MFGFIGQPQSEGFKMFLLVKWIVAAAAAAVDWSVSTGGTMASLDLEINQKPWKFKVTSVPNMHVYRDREGKWTVVPSICFSQTLLTAVIYIQDSPHPPHKRTHFSTRFLGWCESVYSFGGGQLHTWWQLDTVVLAQVRVCEGGGPGERAHRPILQGLLNLYIPVHLALGQLQECPLM